MTAYLLSVAGIALLSGALASEDLDAQIRAMEPAMAEATATPPPSFSAAAMAELETLPLPVSDHLSAVRYCEFFLRHLDADVGVSNRTRERAAWQVITDARPTARLIDFNALFPVIQHGPFFTHRASAPASDSGQVYLAPDTGVCTILTFNEPEAQRKTSAWLQSTSSAWTTAGGNQEWQVYKIREPTRMLQGDLRIFEAKIPDKARAEGITGLHVAALTGLP